MNNSSHAARLMFALLLIFPGYELLAQDNEGTLEKIAKSGEIVIGYRTDASPLSYENADGQPSGYSVDLCRRIAAGVKTHLGMKDIETNVDFTLPTFVTGGSVLSLAAAEIKTFSDLSGKTVGVVKDTTTELQLRSYLEENLIDAEVIVVANRKEGMQRLNRKDIDAFASDQIVLVGQVIEALNPTQYALAEETFSFEPYGFVLRRNDADFRLVANKSLAQLYRSGQHIQIYNKWIGRIGIRPSPMLAAMYQLGMLPE